MSRQPHLYLCRRRWTRMMAAIVLSVLLAACHRNADDGKPVLQGTPAAASTTAHEAADASAAFSLVAASSQTLDSRSALTLRFNQSLASAQAFDDLIAVTGPKGEVISGSWRLEEDRKTLQFPFVQANTRYVIQLKAGLLATDGQTLAQELKREVDRKSVV